MLQRSSSTSMLTITCKRESFLLQKPGKRSKERDEENKESVSRNEHPAETSEKRGKNVTVFSSQAKDLRGSACRRRHTRSPNRKIEE